MADAHTSPDSILIVEDDNDIREALSQILEEEGYRVIQAPHGRLGLDLMEQHHPNLVLLDLMMPVMNGWQFREAQLQHPTHSQIPVVVISADTAARRESEAMQVNGFLQKPIELDELLSVVNSYFPHRRS